MYGHSKYDLVENILWNLAGDGGKVGARVKAEARDRTGAEAQAGARVRVRRKGLEERLEPLPVAACRQAATPRMARRQAGLAPHGSERCDLRLAQPDRHWVAHLVRGVCEGGEGGRGGFAYDSSVLVVE